MLMRMCCAWFCNISHVISSGIFILPANLQSIILHTSFIHCPTTNAHIDLIAAKLNNSVLEYVTFAKLYNSLFDYILI